MSAADFPELLPEWRRLDAAIEREIGRLRARYQLSIDEFRGLYVSDEQVDRLVAATRAAAGEAAVEPVPPVERSAGSRLSRAGVALGLGQLELDLVMLALAPEVDAQYETFFAYLNDEVAKRWPTVRLAARLLAPTGGMRAILEALAPHGRLMSLGAMRAIDPPGAHRTLQNAGFGLARTFVHRLLDLEALAPELAACARWAAAPRSRGDHPSASVLSPELARSAERLPLLLRNASSDKPVVVVLDSGGIGVEPLALAAATALDRRLLVVDLDAARVQGGWPSDPTSALSLQARLTHPAVLLMAPGPIARAADIAIVLRALESSGAPLFVGCDPESDWRQLARTSRIVTLDVDPSTPRERQAVWDIALDRAGVQSSAEAKVRLAGSFAMPPRQVQLAIEAAVDRSVLTGERPDDMEPAVANSARRLLEQRLGSLASKVAQTPTWGDLILPGLTRTRLTELAAAVKNRHLVYSDWGFARSNPAGIGIKALFAGSSGTGKTMAAAVLAHELGFDLYRIDLSGIVSKYIGETEKNLDEIFRGARAGHAILFFDEADALFGKRSEVKDAHDRYANIEVAYLLQKLEDHDGVVILATNLKHNIDEAFSRRMQYVIEFPVPDVSSREALWRGMFGERVPLAPDVDCAFLARQFPLSGGDIRNVALEAAFMAADNGRVVSMKELVRATARQLVKQGRLPTPADFQEFHSWVVGS